MECLDSFWEHGEPTRVDQDKGVLPVEEDHFQCTYFRQSNHDTTLTNEDAAEFNSSATCTDSESEIVEPINSAEWTEASSINSSTLYISHDEIPKQQMITHDHKPRVMFDQTLYVHSDSATNLHLETEPTKLDYSPVKLVHLNGEYYLMDEGSLRNSNMKLKRPQIPNNENRSTPSSKLLFVNWMNSNRHQSATPAKRTTLNGNKRTYNHANDRAVWKKPNSVENRAVKYKRILKSVEDVIHELGELETVTTKNKVAKTNLAKAEKHTEPGPKNQKIMGDHPLPEEPEMRRPFFMKPELENFLNDSMRRAVKMYRTCRNTWTDIKQQKLGRSQNYSKTNISVS